jgi:hypothetical protein
MVTKKTGAFAPISVACDFAGASLPSVLDGEGLFDGRHTGDEVLNGLPGSVNEPLTPFGLSRPSAR